MEASLAVARNGSPHNPFQLSIAAERCLSDQALAVAATYVLLLQERTCT